MMVATQCSAVQCSAVTGQTFRQRPSMRWLVLTTALAPTADQSTTSWSLFTNTVTWNTPVDLVK